MTDTATTGHGEGMVQSAAARLARGGMAARPEESRGVSGGRPLSPEAFDELYETWFTYVWRTARRLGVSDAHLDDVAQDVFLVVHRRLGDFEGRSTFKTWLFGIAYRVVRDHRRSQTRRATVAPPVEELGLAAAGPGPFERAEQAQARRLLHAILGEMDDDKREVFVLAELEGFTAPEIASITGAKLNTVYSRLRAARARFEAGLARRAAGQDGGAP